uniref:Uncharacterized protein n=1 Tax=Arundo donax TaxID=35708 RepID=A0A0A9GUT4_ARUDO
MNKFCSRRSQPESTQSNVTHDDLTD